MKYKEFVEDNFTIIDKTGTVIPFRLNAVQEAYMKHATNKDIILKARQQGFSSLILAMFTADFILTENSNSVVVADKSDNAIALLERVKHYIQSYEQINNCKVPLRYNSKYQLVNAYNNATYTIGTAQEANFGRSRTLRNLHLSEAAFYPDLPRILAGAAQAVVPDGMLIIETTANGFNELKTLWDDSVNGETAYEPLFFKASDFYSPDYLIQKRKELGERLFNQEYPASPELAFITSGNPFFDADAMKWYLNEVRKHENVQKNLSSPHLSNNPLA